MFRVPELTVDTPAPNSIKSVLLSWGPRCCTRLGVTTFHVRPASIGVLIDPTFDSRNWTRSCRFFINLLELAAHLTMNPTQRQLHCPLFPMGWYLDGLGRRRNPDSCFYNRNMAVHRRTKGVISLVKSLWGWDTFAFLIQKSINGEEIGDTYLLRQTRQASGTRRLFFAGGRGCSDSFSGSKSVFIDFTEWSKRNK